MCEEKVKKCSKCRAVKPLVEFSKDKSRKDRHTMYCKNCLSEIRTKRFEKDSDKIRKQEKAWRVRNKCKVAQDNKMYREKNKEKILLYKQGRGEEKKAANSRYYEKHKKIINEKNKKRRRSDVVFKIKKTIRDRIYINLKDQGVVREHSIYELIGCSVFEYVNYIGSKFTRGMTWQKYLNGEMHIDHIRSCSSFDLSDIEQQKLCFCYLNTQPMFVSEHMKKAKNLRGIYEY